METPLGRGGAGEECTRRLARAGRCGGAELRFLDSVDILGRLFRCQHELKACRPVRDVSLLNVEIDKTI